MPQAEAIVWPDPPLRSSKVIIAGFATESRGEAPYEDPTYEVWGLNMCERWMLLDAHGPGRVDRIWELHDRATLEQEEAEETRGVKHLSWLRENRTTPIYMTDAQPDIPMSRRMPVEELKAFFSDRCEKFTRTPYYTSTFSFMVATAVMGIVGRRRIPSVPEADEHLVIAGVELLNGSEYQYERSCAEFWCGVVLGYGIPLTIPSRSALLESDGLYGYTPPDNLELLVRMKGYYTDLREKAVTQRDEAHRKKDAAIAEWHTCDGTRQGLERVINHLTYLIRGGKV